MSKIRLAIRDKRECILQGFAKLLSDEPSLEIVSVTNVWEETVKECEEHQPDVILISSDLFEYDSIEDIQALHKRLPTSNIALIIDRVTTDQFISTVAAGVKVLLSPRISVENLVSAIRLAAEGQIIISPQISTRILEGIQSIYTHQGGWSLKVDTLVSNRERGVLSLVKRGLTNKEIAVSLGISEYTVKVHMRNIMEKLHAHTRQEAVNSIIQRDVVHSIHLN